MEKEKIEKAARKKLKGIVPVEWNQKPFIDIFVDAARWRINAIWHDAKTETPVRNGYIAVISPNGIMETMWYNAGIGFDETRLRVYAMWTYVANLLPDTRNEAKL